MFAMRKLTIVIASVACCLPASAFAQTTPVAQHDAAPTQSAAPATPAAQAQSQSDNGSAHGFTRAEVYQQLAQAENDGTLAHLNATVYAHH